MTQDPESTAKGLTSCVPLALCLALAVGACGCDDTGGTFETSVPGVADPSLSETVLLTEEDVRTIIAQAATQATMFALPVTIAVVDHEGIVLGILQMDQAPTTTAVSGGGNGGLEGEVFNGSAMSAAITKAGTAAFLSTQGSALTTRSAGYILQDHFPPEVDPSPGGPLFGVQLSNLRCSDVDRGPDTHKSEVSNLPIGLSADPGGLPLYKNGVAVGGIGVEGDGVYSVDRGQPSTTATVEEMIAAAGTLGFSAPAAIHGDNILVDAIHFQFANADPPLTQATTPYDTFAAVGKELSAPIAAEASAFVARAFNGTDGNVPPHFADGFKAGTTPATGGLTVDDVTQIIGQAAAQAHITRAAIRLPVGTEARVTISVVDAAGEILGMFRTVDAPIFGFDVSAQKARTALFFSSPTAASDLRRAGLAGYADAAEADGLHLDGSVAFSTRAVGFLSQPIYPPGAIPPYSNGPFSTPLASWSVFNTGLQLDEYRMAPEASLFKAPCAGTDLPILKNGITNFPGGFPLYKDGALVGAIGISGDGVDQDDLISFTGATGFEAPPAMRSDAVRVRDVALPYVVLPRHPNL